MADDGSVHDRSLTKAERRRHALELEVPLYIVGSPRPRKIRLSSWGRHAVSLRHTFPGTRAWVEVFLAKRPDPDVGHEAAVVREVLVSELLFETRYPKDASPDKGRDWWDAWVKAQQADARAWGADESRWQQVRVLVDGHPLQGHRISIDDAWAAHIDAPDASLSMTSRWSKSRRPEFDEIELAAATAAEVDAIQW